MTDEQIPGFKVRENFRHQGEERERQRVLDLVYDYFWSACNCDCEGLCDACTHRKQLTALIESGAVSEDGERRRETLARIKTMLRANA